MAATRTRTRTALRAALPAAVVAATVGAAVAGATPETLYLHGAHQVYAADAAADPAAVVEKRAPASAKLTNVVPTGQSSRSAITSPAPDQASTQIGSAVLPTFGLPAPTPVTTVCLDVWLAPRQGQSSVDLTLVLVKDDGTAVTAPSVSQPATGFVRLRKTVNVAATSVTAIAFAAGVAGQTNTLAYDSTAHASSVTIDAASCGEEAPQPTPSSMPGEDPEPSADPSADPTDEPPGDPGSTPTPTATATETRTRYTGPASAKYGSRVLLTASVRTATGSPVAAGSVTFYFAGKEYEVNVQSSGDASQLVLVSAEPGWEIVSIEFSGASGAFGSSDQAPVEVKKGSCTLSLKHSVVDSRSRLTARLSDGLGVVPKAMLRFSRNGRAVASARTSTTGTVVVTTSRGVARDVFRVSWAGDYAHAACSRSLRI